MAHEVSIACVRRFSHHLTRCAVYFFTPDELQGMFRATPPSITADDGDASTPAEPVEETQYDFKTLQLATDRRLLLNRKERKSMWRVWNQVKLQSLYSEPAAQAQ